MDFYANKKRTIEIIKRMVELRDFSQAQILMAVMENSGMNNMAKEYIKLKIEAGEWKLNQENKIVPNQ